MDDNISEFDQIYSQMCGHIEWFDAQSSIHQRRQVKATHKDDYYLGSMEQIHNNQTQELQVMNNTMENQHQVGGDPNPTKQNGNSFDDSKTNTKTKFITKSNHVSYLSASINKAKLKQHTITKVKSSSSLSSSSKCNSRLEESNSRTKSKVNNMGGYLIGTFSDILNMKGNYRFLDGVYQIYIHSNWVQIGNINPYDVLIIEKEMALLKFKLSTLPRKQGAKKDLINILNDEECQSGEVRLSKLLIRKQILYSMGQRGWLIEHVDSRGFKPENDDRLGTKKRQRHEAYLSYLIAIEYSLRTKNKLIKRVTL